MNLLCKMHFNNTCANLHEHHSNYTFFFSFENDRLEWMMIMICKEKKTNKEINKIWYLKKKKSSEINNLIWFFLKKWLDKLYKVECSAKIDNNFCKKIKKKSMWML